MQQRRARDHRRGPPTSSRGADRPGRPICMMLPGGQATRLSSTSCGSPNFLPAPEVVLTGVVSRSFRHAPAAGPSRRVLVRFTRRAVDADAGERVVGLGCQAAVVDLRSRRFDAGPRRLAPHRDLLTATPPAVYVVYAWVACFACPGSMYPHIVDRGAHQRDAGASSTTTRRACGRNADERLAAAHPRCGLAPSSTIVRSALFATFSSATPTG